MAHRLVARLHPSIAVSNSVDAQQRTNDLVVGKHPVGVGHEYPLGAVAIPGRHLNDLGPVRTSSFVHSVEKFNLASFGDRVGLVHDHVGTMPFSLGETDGSHTAPSLARSSSRRRRCSRQAALRQVRGVGKTGGLASDHPDPCTTVTAAGDLFDASVVETSRR